MLLLGIRSASAGRWMSNPFQSLSNSHKSEWHQEILIVGDTVAYSGI